MDAASPGFGALGIRVDRPPRRSSVGRVNQLLGGSPVYHASSRADRIGVSVYADTDLGRVEPILSASVGIASHLTDALRTYSPERGLFGALGSTVIELPHTPTATAARRPVLRNVREHPLSEDLPYVSLVQALIGQDKISAARTLLATAVQKGTLEPEILKLYGVLTPPKARASKRTDVERNTEYTWLAEHASEYPGKWLAVNGNQLLAQAVTLKDLRSKLAALKPERVPLIYFVE